MGKLEKQPSGLFVPKRTPASDDSMRAMVAEAFGNTHQPLSTLDSARAVKDGVMILQGDDGGTIYAVCPAARVRCDTDDLSRLLLDLDAVIWRQPDAVGLFYERYPVGAVVPGGMGGGLVTPDVWTHRVLAEKDLTTAIKSVISGKSKNLRGVAEYVVAHNEFNLRREEQRRKMQKSPPQVKLEALARTKS